MSAARNIPMPQVTEQISIDSTLTPTPQGALYATAGTEVEFYNNSGTTINITFSANPPNSGNAPLFSNIVGLQNGATSGPWPPASSNGSVNYTITQTQGGPVVGPFSIQIGTGVIVVSVKYVGNAPVSTPLTVAVPQNGQLEMQSSDGNTYPVTGLGSTVFNPAISTVDDADHTAIGAPNSYTYGTTLGAIGGGSGGGKVIIGSNT